MLTAERLRELLHYDPETGVFTWRVNRGGPAKAGSRAGNVNRVLGYLQIRVDRVLYYGHRLAWLYVHGEWPADQQDHVNGMRDDNRLVNLRECTPAENCQNLSIRVSNTSGHIGVSWCSERGKWHARIAVGNRHKHLGRFNSTEAAAAAYQEAKRELHTFNPETRKAES